MAELTVPQIDFSSLGQLPQIWKQGQQDALRQQTLANLGQGTATPDDLIRAGIQIGDLQLANLGTRQKDTEYQHGRDVVGDQRWAITDKRAANADARAGAAERRSATDWENTPDQYVPNPSATQPGQPQYIDQYAAATAASGGSDLPTSAKEYQFYIKNFQPTPAAPQPMDYGTFSTAKARAAATNITNSVDTKSETEQSKEVGKALGKTQGADIEAGSHAAQTMRQLATLDNANKAGGDSVSSGPFGELILKGKQGLNEIAGEDLTNAAPSEVIKKVGFGLATNLTKAITNRPAQMEFMKALENVPNLMMSKTGRMAMTSIMMQEKRAEQEIGRIASRHRDIPGGPVYQEVKDKYYEEHPLISPFTGKPFSPDDVDNVIKSVPGGSSASTVAPGGLTRADIEAEIRRRQQGAP